jgi:hypothetical protein
MMRDVQALSTQMLRKRFGQSLGGGEEAPSN